MQIPPLNTTSEVSEPAKPSNECEAGDKEASNPQLNASPSPSLLFKKVPKIKSTSLNRAFLNMSHGNQNASSMPSSNNNTLSDKSTGASNGSNSSTTLTLSGRLKLGTRLTATSRSQTNNTTSSMDRPSGNNLSKPSIGLGINVWRKSAEMKRPTTLTDEELEKVMGIRMAHRLTSDKDRHSRWEEMEDEDDAIDKVIQFADGTRVDLDSKPIEPKQKKFPVNIQNNSSNLTIVDGHFKIRKSTKDATRAKINEKEAANSTNIHTDEQPHSNAPVKAWQKPIVATPLESDSKEIRSPSSVHKQATDVKASQAIQTSSVEELESQVRAYNYISTLKARERLEKEEQERKAAEIRAKKKAEELGRQAEERKSSIQRNKLENQDAASSGKLHDATISKNHPDERNRHILNTSKSNTTHETAEEKNTHNISKSSRSNNGEGVTPAYLRTQTHPKAKIARTDTKQLANEIGIHKEFSNDEKKNAEVKSSSSPEMFSKLWPHQDGTYEPRNRNKSSGISSRNTSRFFPAQLQNDLKEGQSFDHSRNKTTKEETSVSYEKSDVSKAPVVFVPKPESPQINYPPVCSTKIILNIPIGPQLITQNELIALNIKYLSTPLPSPPIGSLPIQSEPTLPSPEKILMNLPSDLMATQLNVSLPSKFFMSDLTKTKEVRNI